MRGPLFTAALIPLVWAWAAEAQVVVPLPGGRPPLAPVNPGAQPATPPAAPAPDAPIPTVRTPGQPPMGAHGRPDINPYERDIDMTVPLMYRDRSLGDLPVRLTFDDQFFVQTDGFLKLIAPKLNAEALAHLTTTLGQRTQFSADDLAGSGVALVYDPSSLAVVVLSISPDKRAVEHLFAPQRDNEGATDMLPARYSGYLNLSLNQSVFESGGRTLPPTMGVNAALRLRGFVIETEGSFSEQNSTASTGSTYGYQRNYVRLVYDQPNSFRRWFLGDLTPEIRGEQSFVQMAGIGVLRSRLPFNDFRTAVLQTNRRLVLQRDSDVSITRNGVPFQQLHLSAGTYDLSSLPLLAGSNDVGIRVRDDTGALQDFAFQSYLDPIDLEPGDYEYGAYVGPINRDFGPSPTYNGPIAFTGFFRKAFLNRPAVGIGVQFSHDVQNVTGQTQLLVLHGGRLVVDAGASHSSVVGSGFAAGAAYELQFDRAGQIDSLTVRADYISRRFAGLATPDVNNTTALTLSGQYARAFTRNLTGTASLTYITQRDGRGANYRADVNFNYVFARHWSVRAGLDYAHFPTTGPGGAARGLGGTISLIWQPNYRTRAEARYDSTIDSAALTVARASNNEIGSLGYGAILSRDAGQYGLSGFADYTGNRFSASVAHATSGAAGSFGSVNATSFTVSTTLAFADHAFGMGRRVGDSFAILYPHRSLHGRTVVAGESVAGNDYIGKSGLFGGALDNALTAYTTQSVQYSVVDPPAGYDIGPGVVRVRPAYRSGYAIQVGADAFVTAMGTLVNGKGAPVSLIGGRVMAVDRPDLPPLPFFTNSVGRFGVLGLRPSLKYRVEIYRNGDIVPAFEFTVPRETEGLVDLNVVSLEHRQ